MLMYDVIVCLQLEDVCERLSHQTASVTVS